MSNQSSSFRDFRPSYQLDASAVTLDDQEKFQPLNESLAHQVQNTRTNLYDKLSDAESDSNDTKDSIGDTSADTVQVMLRIRPFLETELDENQDCIELMNDRFIKVFPPLSSATYKGLSRNGQSGTSYTFSFSRVFQDSVGQTEFYDDAMGSYVKDFLSGQNVLIFTYGVTNSGKSYTIKGPDNNPGILPRALKELFTEYSGKVSRRCDLKPRLYSDILRLAPEEVNAELSFRDRLFDNLAGDLSLRRSTSASDIGEASIIRENEKSSSFSSLPDALDLTRVHDVSGTSQTGCTFSIWISFCEIYNENVFDLLEPVKTGIKRAVLKLSEDAKGNIYVKGLREVCVFSYEEAMQLLEIGHHNLSVAATKLNYASSRSHCIYTVRVLRLSPASEQEQHVQRIHRLNFCDLAGSERSVRTENSGERLKESCNINTSLLTLGRCIKTLRHNQHSRSDSQRLIPFRDSKLTRLFQNTLTGQGKACMIVCASQLASAFDENFQVLKFGAVAQRVITQKSSSNLYYGSQPNGVNVEPSSKLSVLLAQSGKSSSNLLNASLPPAVERCNSTTGNRSAPLLDCSVESSFAAGDSNCSYLDDQDSFASTEGTAAGLLDDDATPVPNTVRQRRVLLEKQQLDKKDQLIEKLTNLLKEERSKNYQLEAKTREEVCAQYGQYIANLRKDYQQDLEEGVGEAQVVAEERIDLYIQSAKKSRRSEAVYRLDENDQEDDCWVPATLLNDARRQLEEKDSQLALLEVELKKTSTVNNSMADNTDMERDSLESNVVDSSTPASSIGGDLETQLQAEKAKSKEMEVLLTEAGDAFKEKEAEILALDQAKKDQESAMTEMTATLEGIQAKVDEYTNELKTKDARIKELEDDNKKEAEIKSDNDSKMEVDDEKLKDLEGKLMAKEAQLTALQAELDGTKTAAAADKATAAAAATAAATAAQRTPPDSGDSDMKLIEYESKIFEVEKERDAALEELGEAKDAEDDLKAKVTDLEKSLEDAKTEMATKTSEMESSASQLAAKVGLLEKNIGDLEKEVEEANRRVKEAETSQTKTEQLLAEKSIEYDSVVAKLAGMEKQLASFQTGSSDLESRCEAAKKTAEEAEAKCTALKATLEKAVQGQMSSEMTRAAMEKELNEAKKRIETLGANNTEAQNAREKELAGLKAQLDQLREESTADKAKIGQFAEERAKWRSVQSDMEQRLSKQGELASLLESKERQITYLQSNHSMELQKLHEELNKTRTQVANANKVSTDQQQETAQLRTQLDLHVQKSHLIEKQLSEMTLKKEEAVSQLNRFKNDQAKDRHQMDQMKQAVSQLEQNQLNYENLLKEKDGRLDYMHRDLQGTKSKMAAADNEGMKMKHECNMLRGNVEQLSKQLHESSTMKESLQTELNTTKMQFSEFQRAATANEHAVHALKKEIEAKINFYEQQKQAAVHKNQMQLAEKEKELMEANRRTQTAEKHAAEMSKELNKYQDDHKTLKEELELEYERMKAEKAGSMDRDLQNARDEIKDLTRQKSELSNRVLQLDSDLKTAQENLAALAEAQRSMSQAGGLGSVSGASPGVSSAPGSVKQGAAGRKISRPAGTFVGTDAAKPEEPEEGEEQMTVDLTSVTPDESGRKQSGKGKRGRPSGVSSSRKRQASETSHVSEESGVSHQDFPDQSSTAASQSTTKSGGNARSSIKKAVRGRGTGGKSGGRGRRTTKVAKPSFDSEEEDHQDNDDQFFVESSVSPPSVAKPGRRKSGAGRGRASAHQIPLALVEAPTASTRPSRRAKTSAADGILAASMGWNSAAETFAKQALSYVSTGSPLSQVDEEEDQSAVPPKKRKRTLFNPGTQQMNDSLLLVEDDGAAEQKPEEEVDTAVETVTRVTRRMRKKK